jgi:proline iminopeptidase
MIAVSSSDEEAMLVVRDRFSLEVIREGSGVPLLIVGSARLYRRAFPQTMREHFEIVFCDLRPYVEAPASFNRTTITLQTHIDDIEAIRQAAGLDRPVVLGHSIHGAIALAYARQHPGSVRGVVSIGGTPIGGGQLWQALADNFEQNAGPQRLAAHEQNLSSRRSPTTYDTRQDVVDRYLADGAMYWYDPAFDASAMWEGIDVNMPLYIELFNTFGDSYQVEPVDVPLFLALGRHDYMAPYHLWDEPRHRFSDLRYRLYDQSGHFPQLEQPDDFVGDLTEWARTL